MEDLNNNNTTASDLQSKVAIVTGSTSGIGRVTTLALARAGIHLVLPVRNLAKGEELKNEILDTTGNAGAEIMECRLDSMDSIRDFVGRFKNKYSRLHVLLNNAGIWEVDHKVSQDGVEMNFTVNHLAPFLLTHLLQDHLVAAAPSRVVTVSSSAHRQGRMRWNQLEKNSGWDFMASYAQSKLANILFTKWLAVELLDKGVTANCLHPGVVRTRLFDKMAKPLRWLFSMLMIPPEKGAETSIFLALSPEVETITGEYFYKKKPAIPSPRARDMEAAKRLWSISKDYCNIP